MESPTLEKEDALYQDIESRIKSIREKKNLYLTLYRTNRIFIFLCGASITILTGWKFVAYPFQQNIILTISAIISLLTAIEGLFDFKDKGKSNNLLLFELRRLRDRICFTYTNNSEAYTAKKSEYFDEFQHILNSQKSIIENSDDEV